jgi:hypothetical protein
MPLRARKEGRVLKLMVKLLFELADLSLIAPFQMHDVG